MRKNKIEKWGRLSRFVFCRVLQISAHFYIGTKRQMFDVDGFISHDQLSSLLLFPFRFLYVPSPVFAPLYLSLFLPTSTSTSTSTFTISPLSIYLPLLRALALSSRSVTLESFQWLCPPFHLTLTILLSDWSFQPFCLP